MRIPTVAKGVRWLVGLGLGIAVVLGLAGVSESQESATASIGATTAQPEPNLTEEAPPALVKELIAAAKNDPMYAVAMEGLTAEMIREAVPEWQVGTYNSLAWSIRDGRQLRLPDGRIVVSEGHSPPSRSGDGGDVCFTVKRGPQAESKAVYRVSFAQLKELDVEYPATLSYTDPANRPIPRFSVHGETFFEVAPKLCTMGDLDLAMPGGAAHGNVTVTLDLRNRTPVECLQYAARAIGFKVTFDITAHVRGRGVSWSRMPNQPVPDVVLQVRDVVDELPPDSRTPDEVVKALEDRTARIADILAENRPVAIATQAVDKASEH